MHPAIYGDSPIVLLRPSSRVTSTKAAARWWRYVIQATLEDIHAKHEVWSWRFLRRRRDQRHRYMPLYKEYASSKKPSKSLQVRRTFGAIVLQSPPTVDRVFFHERIYVLCLQESLEHAESELSASDIIMYRELVHEALDKQAKIDEAENKKKKEAKKGSGWFGWMGGSKSKHKVSTLMEGVLFCLGSTGPIRLF